MSIVLVTDSDSGVVEGVLIGMDAVRVESAEANF
jgi:hypothetical protein